MNLAGLDLNLLIALEALLCEAHVGRAARKIGLSQPATSHALGRLRDLLGDPLLVRVGSRMQRTRRAEELREPLAQALEQVRGLFDQEPFNPLTSRRRFTLLMPDHVVDLVLPRLTERMASRAPGVRLDVAPWRGAISMTAELARAVDLVIACAAEAFPGFHHQRLFSDTEALAVRRGHPLGARLRKLPAFLEARHVAVVLRGQREDPIDTWLGGEALREKHIQRNIALVVPSYLQALHLAARTDLVAFVPRRLIEALARPLDLAVITPPIDPGEYEEFLFHPARAQTEEGSLWLRQQVLEIGRRLDRGKVIRRVAS